MKTDHLTWVDHIWRSISFKYFILKVYFSRIKLCLQWFIENNVSEIYQIRHEKYEVIRWNLKGCTSKTIGFQGMVLLQILISIKFAFQKYKIWPVLQVKNFTCTNCLRHQPRDLNLWLPQHLEQNSKRNNYTKLYAFNTICSIVKNFYHYILHYKAFTWV